MAKTAEEARELLIKHLRLSGEEWQPSNGGKPFDLFKGDKKIEIKSSGKQGFNESFSAVSISEIIESLKSNDYLFYFVNKIEKPIKEITIIKPDQIFQILSRLYPYPKFEKKKQEEIIKQFKRYEIDSDGNIIGSVNESIINKKMEEEGIKDFIKKIDEEIEEFENLKELLKNKLKS